MYKSKYTKADLKDLCFFYADHSSQHYSYGGTPLSDHPLVKGAQGSNYNYSTWMGNGTIFQSSTCKRVLADNGAIPVIRAISPFDFLAVQGTPPTTFSGNTGNITGYSLIAGACTRTDFAKPSKFTECIKKIFTTKGSFSIDHDIEFAKELFNTNYATTLLNSVQQLVNSGDFINYNLERLGGVSRSNGNWAEGMFSVMPVIDDIITQYSETNGLYIPYTYFKLFKTLDINKVNLFVWFSTSENYYSNANQYGYTSGYPDAHYSIFYITEIGKVPNAFNNIEFYKSKRNSLLSEIANFNIEYLRNDLNNKIEAMKEADYINKGNKYYELGKNDYHYCVNSLSKLNV